MHFAFTEQQTEFRDAVRQVLAKECTTDDLRSAFGAPTARGPRWTTLASLGVTGISVPEAQGGLGLGLVDLVLLLEEAGRVALPEPLVETTALTAPLLAELHGDARVHAWLAAIAGGELAAAVSMSPGGTDPVAGAVGAGLFVLATAGTDGPELHVLDAASVAVTPVPSLDPTRRLGRTRWDSSEATRVARGPAATDAMRRTSDRAAVATGAELLGLSQRMISLAAEYAKERHQFGKTIGSFQAVKHLLAGAQVKLEFARPMVYGAAWSLDHQDPSGSRSASAAKAYASDASTEAARVALQVHGAVGYTWECDLHLFLKRAWALAEAWGSAADHRARVLASLVSPV